MTFFRYWNYTTCIEFKNFNILEQKVTQLLETEEGCRRLSQLPELKYTLNQLRNHPWERLPNLWIIGLFEGANQRTIIKTFPTGILCSRASNANRPRLSNLTKQIKCNAFHLEVNQDVGGFLFKADAMGNTFLSDCPGAEAPDNFKFYDEQQIDKPDREDQLGTLFFNLNC